MPDRVFIAIDPPRELRTLLANASGAFTLRDPGWAREKPVAAHLLHLTLAFLGPVADTEMPVSLELLRIAAAGVDPFELAAARVRALPSTRSASMVWASFEGECERTAELAGALRRAVGLPDECRPFSAHVTLVRSRRPRAVDSDAIVAADRVLSDPGKDSDRSVSVRFATVYASTLHGDGPRYERLAELRIGPTRVGTGID